MLVFTSGYFDAALKGRTKKSRIMKFEFPHLDPNEWEWILSLFTPFPSTGLAKENVHTALSWFDELRSLVGMEACDRFYAQSIMDSQSIFVKFDSNMARADNQLLQSMKTELAQVLGVLATSDIYSLEKTKDSSCGAIQHVLKWHPYLFEVEQMRSLISLLAAQSGDKMKGTWHLLKRFIPVALSSQSLEALAKNDIVPLLILSEIQFFEAMDRVCEFADAAITNNNSKEHFLRLIRTDEVCGKYCAEEGRDDRKQASRNGRGVI